MRTISMLGLAWMVGCGPSKPSEPPLATTVEMDATQDEAPAVPSEREPAAVAAGLLKLIVLKKYLRLSECGHDRSVGPLRCGYKAAGDEQPTAPEHTLRAFLTDPPGIVLAAGDFQAPHAVEKNDVVLADCRFEEKGTLDDVHLGATQGVRGYLHAAPIVVGTATECTFEPYAGLPERMKAAHLLVMHDDSRRKPATLSRSRDEALERARRARTELESSGGFAEVVARYSDEPGAKKRGGGLGRFPQGAMVPEFEIILLSTPIGKRSVVFESSFGFHVLERQATQ